MRGEDLFGRRHQYTDDGFTSFWEAYPRHVGKVDAMKAWKKIAPNSETIDAILAALKWQPYQKQWRDIDFVPHPASWLRGERWKDERPQLPRATARSKPQWTEDQLAAARARDEANRLATLDVAEQFYRKRPWLPRPNASQT